MTKTKLNRLIDELVAENGDRIVIDYWDRDDNVSYRTVTFKEYVDVFAPCCRGDIEKLEGLLKRTEDGPLKVKDHFIHNTPEDIARRKEEARKPRREKITKVKPPKPPKEHKEIKVPNWLKRIGEFQETLFDGMDERSDDSINNKE